MQKTRIFVFDADGVVIEPWGFANVLQRDFDISKEDTLPFFAGPFQLCLSGHAELIESLRPFLKRWNWFGSVEEFVQLWLQADDQPRDDVVTLIRKLRASGFCCYLASNQEAIRANYIRNTMEFESEFDGLFFSCDLGVAKPDLGFYQAIAEQLTREPECIWFWDDTEECVTGAQRAGWNAFVYDSPESITSITERYAVFEPVVPVPILAMSKVPQ